MFAGATVAPTITIAEKDRVIQIARRLRRDMTDPEQGAGIATATVVEHRLRRQVPFDRYVADFASHGLRLIIEDRR